MPNKLTKKSPTWVLGLVSLIAVLAFGQTIYSVYVKQAGMQQANIEMTSENTKLNEQIEANNKTILEIQAEIDRLNNEDLRKTNAAVRKEINDLKVSYRNTVVAYEAILNLEDLGAKVSALQGKFASVLNYLA